MAERALYRSHCWLVDSCTPYISGIYLEGGTMDPSPLTDFPPLRISIIYAIDMAKSLVYNTVTILL
jgi:hypothetical protein